MVAGYRPHTHSGRGEPVSPAAQRGALCPVDHPYRGPLLFSGRAACRAALPTLHPLPVTPPGPVSGDILTAHPPTHTMARSTYSLASFRALVDQLPGAQQPTRLPLDAQLRCLCAFAHSNWQTDGPATVTPGAEGVPAPSQFGASLTGRVTVAKLCGHLAHTHRAS